MKTFTLCCVGFLVGSAAAFITQTPVLETLGYAPKASAPIASASKASETITDATDVVTAETPDVGEDNESKPAERVAAVNDASEKEEASKEIAQAKPSQDSSVVPDHYSLFSKGTFTTKSDVPYQLPYRLLKPTKIVPGKKYPLTVFLHGAGERGSDNESQLTHGSKEFVQWIEKVKFESYVLFPQCPLEQQWADHNWHETNHTAKSTPTQSMSALLGLIDEIRSNEPVDDDHIFASGLSMGGFGVYDLVARRPGFFASAVAFCGGSDCSPQFVQKLATTPMYIVHGQADTVVSVENSRNVVAALQRAGANPNYVELPSIGHDCWKVWLESDYTFRWLFMGLDPSGADATAEVKVASRPAPKKVTNSYTKPGASSEAPSIRTKKNSFFKKKDVVAKPPMDGVKPETTITKTPVAKAKPPVAKTKPLVAKTKPPVTKAKPLAKESKSVAKSTKTPKAKATVKKPESLSGQWQVTNAVHAGRVLSKKRTKAMVMEFVDGDIVIKHGKKRETGTFEIGEFVSAGESEFAELEIKSNRKNTPSIKGFFNKKGEVLTMVWGAPGEERPDPNDAEELEAARTLTLKPSVY